MCFSSFRDKLKREWSHIHVPCRLRKKCLRIINESNLNEIELFNHFHRFRDKALNPARKFVVDSIGDGYIRIDPSTRRYHLTKEGRQLLYDLDRQFYETVRYVITTIIAVAALAVSILR